MTVLVDTNVILDVCLRRDPFYADSARVWAKAEQGRVRAMVAAITLTSLFYIARKHMGRPKAMAVLKGLRGVFGIAACDEAVMIRAMDSEFADFEDAVQFHCAVAAGARCIVTRDAGHFPVGEPVVLTPGEFLSSLADREAGGE